MARDIDQITAKLALEIPGIYVQQLQVSHPGSNDDGLWFIDIPGREERTQLESPDGNCPFLIESEFSAERLHASSIDEVIEAVKRLYSQVLAQCYVCRAGRPKSTSTVTPFSNKNAQPPPEAHSSLA